MLNTMKKISSKVKRGFAKTYLKADAMTKKAAAKVLLALAPFAAMLGMGDIAFAAGAADSVINQVIDVILTIARYGGIVFAVTGIFQLIMAYKDDNADAKGRAITLTIVGIVLVFLKTVVDPIKSSLLGA